jgi:FkbM family methyltransferase
MRLKRSLFTQILLGNSARSRAIAHDLIIVRMNHKSTHARLSWFHSAARSALVSFFGSEETASDYVTAAISEKDRLEYDGPPTVHGDHGEFDPSGTLDHFRPTSNHRDASYVPPCTGLATYLLMCWSFYASQRVAYEVKCKDFALLACHYFNGQKNLKLLPGIAVPDYSSEISTRHGVMHILILDVYFSASLAVYGEWSTLESDLIARSVPPGGTFLDIGAHVGTISAAIAQHVGTDGKVIAVEAQSNLCELIVRTATKNSMPQLKVINAAIDASTSMCGTAAESSSVNWATNYGGFNVSKCGQYHKRLMLSKAQRADRNPIFYSDSGLKQAVVNSVSMDSLVKLLRLNALHAIKLDCEGAEHTALLGGLQAIKTFLPAIFFEDNTVVASAHNNVLSPYTPTSTAMKKFLVQHLQPLGYVCSQIQIPLFNPRNFRGLSENIFGGQSSFAVKCLSQRAGAGV